MRRSRKIALVLLPAPWLIAGGWTSLDCVYRPSFTAGPMVQMVEPDGFSLVWSLAPPHEATVEVFSTEGAPAGTVKLSDDNGWNVATVTGLAPGTSYHYRIRALAWGRPATLREETVQTAPPPGQPFRFLAFGDSGNGSLAQWSVAARLREQDADLIIHTGDLIYSAGEAENYPSRFYQPYDRLIARIPFYACLGNHDNYTLDGKAFLDAFILPRNNPPGGVPERDYWFDYGDVRFVAIDSNHDVDVLQTAIAPWLEEVLAAAGERWKIVFFHEPPYTNGRYEPAAKIVQAIVPVLDRQRADLVLCGHNHMYERTYPIRNGVPLIQPPAGDPATTGDRGTVYVVTGGGGGNLYEQRPTRPAYMAAWYDQRHSFTVVEVTANEIRWRQINDLGETVDEASIQR